MFFPAVNDEIHRPSVTPVQNSINNDELLYNDLQSWSVGFYIRKKAMKSLMGLLDKRLSYFLFGSGHAPIGFSLILCKTYSEYVSSIA